MPNGIDGTQPQITEGTVPPRMELWPAEYAVGLKLQQFLQQQDQ